MVDFLCCRTSCAFVCCTTCPVVTCVSVCECVDDGTCSAMTLPYGHKWRYRAGACTYIILMFSTTSFNVETRASFRGRVEVAGIPSPPLPNFFFQVSPCPKMFRPLYWNWTKILTVFLSALFIFHRFVNNAFLGKLVSTRPRLRSVMFLSDTTDRLPGWEQLGDCWTKFRLIESITFVSCPAVVLDSLANIVPLLSSSEVRSLRMFTIVYQ